MFRPFVSAALATAALAVPAFAEQAVMTRPIEAASLHDGPLDMVAYYVPAEHGALEVTANFAPREPQPETAYTEPMRIVMALNNGDDVSFAMPGYPQALYRFTRAAEGVAVSVLRPDPVVALSRERVASSR
jgi:hypothetical protein